MKILRRLLMTVLSFGSWGLALYLFYIGSVLGGLGSLVSSFLFVFCLGFGEAFAKHFGPDVIKKAKEEGRVEGRNKARKGWG